jgi:hypothetical protein
VWTTEDVWFNTGNSKRFYLSIKVQTGSCAHPAYYLMVLGVPFLRIKRPDREADH